jgi:hypothetical protein
LLPPPPMESDLVQAMARSEPQSRSGTERPGFFDGCLMAFLIRSSTYLVQAHRKTFQGQWASMDWACQRIAQGYVLPTGDWVEGCLPLPPGVELVPRTAGSIQRRRNGPWNRYVHRITTGAKQRLSIGFAGSIASERSRPSWRTWQRQGFEWALGRQTLLSDGIAWM